MKNVYDVTRPTWAVLDSHETFLITSATVIIALYAAGGRDFAARVFATVHLQALVQNETYWRIFDSVFTALLVLGLIKFYQKLRIRRYPSTFIYCFLMPGKSNPKGMSRVLGFCQLIPNRESGLLTMRGASYFWDEAELTKRTGFTSTHVWGSKDDNGNLCYVTFNIDDDDRGNRLYHSGMLLFQQIDKSIVSASSDAYAGYLASASSEIEIHTHQPSINARGYAEWFTTGLSDEAEIEDKLRAEADVLFAKLRRLRDSATPPSIWNKVRVSPIFKTNCWGLDIPTPQSVILNAVLKSYLHSYLTAVLTSIGLTKGEIMNFVAFAETEAKRLLEDSIATFERTLKVALADKLNDHMLDVALNERAKIIFGEIKEHLQPTSLLDIGCGNGLVSNLAKSIFTERLLVDVQPYVVPALELPFKQYSEGSPLPVDTQFDTVLLLTVLHHSSEPTELLKLAWAATRKRLIIIESIVGVRENRKAPYDLAMMAHEDQIAFAAFVDWFYNRVLHKDISVPLQLHHRGSVEVHLRR